MKEKQKAPFIVIEGTDGSGKSTQIELLCRKLDEQKIAYHSTLEPTDRPIGRLIRKVLTHEFIVSNDVLAALFLSDRIDHLTNDEDGILKKLKENFTVISDRYYLSSIAYNSLNSSMEWVYQLNQRCMDIRRPDLTIFLELDVQESLRRIATGRDQVDLFEKEDILTRIKNQYDEAIQMLSPHEKIVKINADNDPEWIHAQIWEEVSQLYLNI